MHLAAASASRRSIVVAATPTLPAGGRLTLCLAGDVMTGRGVDQMFAQPSDPRLRELYVRDARDYLDLVERRSGPIARPVSDDYVWGEALKAWDGEAPVVRLVNLETSITASNDYWPDKSIHYRMHPRNVGCLTAARVCCGLANNHVLDFGRAGLLETLETLERAKLLRAGAGRDLPAAQAPAVIELASGRRLLVFASASRDSGVPPAWAAGTKRPGVDLLSDLSTKTAESVCRRIEAGRRDGDVVVVSLHWGGNWGYDVPREHVAFAHALVDGGVDVVHGHSSHHVRPLEIYRRRLILYGCGDFLNDYEGIHGYESFRGDLTLLYAAALDPASGALLQLRLVPLQIRRMQLVRATADDRDWLERTISEISAPFGVEVSRGADGALIVAPKRA